MITTGTDQQTFSDTLILLEHEFDEKCDWNNCEQERTHLLACPKCPATENMCEPHTEAAKAADIRERVIFNRTCNHNVPIVACGKIRVSH